MRTDWDDAYANMAHVSGSENLPELWTERAAQYRLNLDSRLIETDVSYGTAPREAMDFVLPEKSPLGLAVFVHGGYWMRLDKSYWTDLAQGARACGWAVCIPSYTLTPEVSIPKITAQIAKAINTAAKRIDGPIRLAGHSAGGHLVSRMVCVDSKLDESVRARIEHTLSISGLHDLRPLMKTKMNEVLQLDEAQAIAESPALLRPAGNPALTAWVGGGERPEFIRQAKLITNIWTGLGANTHCVVDGEHNHFTVIEDLKNSDSRLTKAFIGNNQV